MYLIPRNLNYWAIDIETDGLKPTVIWCLCAQNIFTKEKLTFTDQSSAKEWYDSVRKDVVFIGHNIIKFDSLWLNRLWGFRLSINDLIDTFLLSMVYSPSLSGGHSLDDWGLRLGQKKISFSDWSKLSDEMIEYCVRDVEITVTVYLRLIKRMRDINFSEAGVALEHKSWALVAKQQRTGFFFNKIEAEQLYALLLEKTRGLEEEIHKLWPPVLQEVGRYKNARKKDGTFNKQYERHRELYSDIKLLNDGGYAVYEFVPFNLGSPPQRIAKLQELGWKHYPTEVTEKGNPKVTHKGDLVQSLKDFVEASGNTEVTKLAEWITINSRASMVNTWLQAYDEDTKAIHGSLWLANSLRYRHSNPNSANIPAVQVRKNDEGKEYPLLGSSGFWTYEARNLWQTRDPKTRRLVGVDAKGIQLRVLAQYLNNTAFTQAVVEGDPHSYNQEIGGFRTRSVAKTFIYAFLLGAGDGKVGEIIGGTTKDGRDTKERFIGNFPGLKELLDDLKKQMERTSRIRLCDGSQVIPSAPHTVLGYLLQGDESRIMKQAAIIVDRDIKKAKLDVLKVGDIHDEWQNDVLIEHVDPFIDICRAAFAETQQIFNYRVPLECDAKIGLTWASTH